MPLNPDYIPWPLGLLLFIIVMGIWVYFIMKDLKSRREYSIDHENHVQAMDVMVHYYEKAELEHEAAIRERDREIRVRRQIEARRAQFFNSPTPLFDQMAFEAPTLKELI